MDAKNLVTERKKKYVKDLVGNIPFELSNSYILCALEYNLKDQLAQFSKSELEDIIANSDQCIGICRGTSGEYEYYTDIVYSKYLYGISFGVLYEILKREGFEVTGDENHYTVTGKNGSTYEISYEFNNYDFVKQMYGSDEIEQHKGYYYICDGNIMPMSAYFYNHFYENEIEDMFGLKLCHGTMGKQPE